jgi:hypothetical protein
MQFGNALDLWKPMFKNVGILQKFKYYVSNV